MVALVLAGVTWPGRASACSLAIPRLLAPDYDARVPRNFRFLTWANVSSPESFHLLDAQGASLPLRVERLGGRIDAAPLTTPAPGGYHFGGPGFDDMQLTIRSDIDTTPPQLKRVGRPEKIHYPAQGTCGASDDTSIRLEVTDDSPVVIAVWGSASGEPDLSKDPVLYTRIEDGTIQLWHARETLGLAAGKGRWAVMAIDAAGNVSDVVRTPSQQRSPGVVFAVQSGSPQPGPKLETTPSSPPTQPTEPTPSAPPAQRPPTGCGCTVPGSEAPVAPLAPASALALLVGWCARRRRRPSRP